MSADERMERILDAAYTCFTRHGVRRTTMEDIAREAGLSRPVVYQSVRNKQDAFRRLAARLLEESLTGARAAIAGPGELAPRLSGALAAKLGLAARLWRDGPAHAAELLGVDARLSAEQVDAYNAKMRDLIADAVSAARPDVDATEIAELLLALTRGLEADLSDAGVPFRRLRHAVTLLVAGLGPAHDTPKETV